MGKLVVQDKDEINFNCYGVRHQTSLASLSTKKININMSFCDYIIKLEELEFINDSLFIDINVFASRLTIILPCDSRYLIKTGKGRNKGHYRLIENDAATRVVNIQMNRFLSKIKIIKSETKLA